MNTPRKFWIVLTSAVLAFVIIACSCRSTFPWVVPTPTLPVVVPSSTLPVNPTPTQPLASPTSPQPVTPAPTPPLASPTSNQPVNPLPELAGYWQDGSRVFTIEWQNNQYVVTAITAPGTSVRTLTSQSWNGSSLTWSYAYSDENSNSTITFTTGSISGDTLTADYSSSDGESSIHFLTRNSSPVPSYTDLPYSDDFGSSSTGWDVYDTAEDGAGVENGYYFVISRTNQYSSYGEAYIFIGDSITEVDATPVSGPSGNNYSYNLGCRVQSNADGYLFEIAADGYFMVGYYTGGGHDYTALSGDEWLSSPAILPGLVTNHIAVTCAGNQIKLEVNGQVLYDGQDSTYTEGDISLGAATYDDNNTPAEVHFDNLLVSAP